MRMRITDLLDNYYDDSVKLSLPKDDSLMKNEKDAENSPLNIKQKSKNITPILVVAASLLVIIVGAALYLRLYVGAPENGEAMVAPEPSEPSETDELESTATANVKDYYTWILNLPISDEEYNIVGYIESFQLDMKNGSYMWVYDLPELSDYIREDFQTLEVAMDNPEFMASLHRINRWMAEQYADQAKIVFSDGTEFLISDTEARTIGYGSDPDGKHGRFTLTYPDIYQKDLAELYPSLNEDMIPDYLEINGTIIRGDWGQKDVESDVVA